MLYYIFLTLFGLFIHSDNDALRCIVNQTGSTVNTF